MESIDRALARRTLRFTAVVSTVFGVVNFLGLLGKLIVNGSIHAASSPALNQVFSVVGLLWDLTLVVLFLALRRLVPKDRALFADLGAVFVVLMDAVSSINWFVQLTLVPQLSPSENPLLLALLDVHNLDSLMYALEHLAWGPFFGLAALSMGWAVRGGRLDAWIRGLFIAVGLMSLAFVPGRLASNDLLIDLGYYAAAILLPITTVLLTIRYRGVENDL